MSKWTNQLTTCEFGAAADQPGSNPV